MTIEALEKLRHYAEASWEPWAETRGRLSVMFDEIEREVAERFMERPKTIDGEPIRVGDKLRACGCIIEVAALTSSRVYYFDEFGECGWKDSAKNCRHVKPRTLEDVLEEFAELPERIDRIAAARRYADEIRELMEVGE